MPINVERNHTIPIKIIHCRDFHTNIWNTQLGYLVVTTITLCSKHTHTHIQPIVVFLRGHAKSHFLLIIFQYQEINMILSDKNHFEIKLSNRYSRGDEDRNPVSITQE